jgi:hypothetical protein
MNFKCFVNQKKNYHLVSALLLGNGPYSFKKGNNICNSQLYFQATYYMGNLETKGWEPGLGSRVPAKPASRPWVQTPVSTKGPERQECLSLCIFAAHSTTHCVKPAHKHFLEMYP